MSDAGKWPKSFRWHADFNGKHDIVTFTWEHDIDTDATGVIWAYRDCHDISVWVPTDQHKQKSTPAPSQDDVKADVAVLLAESRRLANDATFEMDEAHHSIRPLVLAVRALADAVERLAK